MRFRVLGDDWFGRVLPVLVVLQLLVVVAWATLSLDRARNPRVQALQPSPQAAPATAGNSPHLADVRVREAAGIVSTLRLGMTIGQARGVLGDDLVQVQHARGARGRFELVDEREALRLAGARGRIDTIAVLGTDAGARFATSRGLRIGHSRAAVTRKYAYARMICGREYWIRTGPNTLRVAVHGRVERITLTSRKAPRYVDCFA